MVHGSGAGNLSLWICVVIIRKVGIVMFFSLPTSHDCCKEARNEGYGSSWKSIALSKQKFPPVTFVTFESSLVISMGTNKQIVSSFSSRSIIPLKLSLC